MEKIQPTLRFPEFEGDWSDTDLRSHSELITKGTTPSEFIQHGSVNYVKIESLRGNNIDLRACLKIDEDVHNSSLRRSILAEGDILFAIAGATIGKCAVVTKDILPANTNQALSIIRLKNNISLKFVILNLTSSSMQNYILSNLTAGAQPNLNLQQIGNYRLSIPTLPEQTKIAEFLTAIDKRIELLTAKKEKLTLYKKGVMQKIFNQEIRFRDDEGGEFPEWEERRLGEVTKIYDGTHQTPEYVEMGVPFYSVEHITAKQFSKTKFISEEIYEKECKRVKLEKGDILMTRIGSIGDTKLIDWDVRASFYVSLAVIKIKSEKIESKYLNHFLNSRSFQNDLWRRSIHVAFPKKINLGEIGECKVLIPRLEEQRKIASFLTSIETDIQRVEQQITLNQKYKKGLLQKMFV
jgi:type I restriction enzyme S subunit